MSKQAIRREGASAVNRAPTTASPIPEAAPAAPFAAYPVLQLQARIGNRATRHVIQRLSAGRAPAETERDVPASTSGRPLPEAVQQKMEGAFGAGFSDVRVHPGSPRATALGAAAYTQGSDIHVAPGHWAPETTRGQELLGHELAHVVQQRAGRVRATAQMKGVALNDDPALEAEADAMGARAARGEAGGPWVSAGAGRTAGHSWDRSAQPNQPPGATPPADAAVQRFPVKATWGKPSRYYGGTRMEAEVGAESEWKYGSKPNANTPTIIKKVGKIVGGKPRYIAGHLLNDNMGGLGENQNLTVLSSDANKRHRGVEGKVKALAQIADQIRPGSRLGDSRYQHGAEYTVTVLPPSPSGSVPYDPSEEKLASGLEITIKPIRKDIAGNNHPWPEQQGGPNELTKHRVDNVPPYPSVPNVTKVSPLEKEVIDAIKALGPTHPFKDILNYINKNRGTSTPQLKPGALKVALKRAIKNRRITRSRGGFKLAV